MIFSSPDQARAHHMGMVYAGSCTLALDGLTPIFDKSCAAGAETMHKMCKAEGIFRKRIAARNRCKSTLFNKLGFGEITDDDRATRYGAQLTLVAELRGENRQQAMALWKGKRALKKICEGPHQMRPMNWGHTGGLCHDSNVR